MRLLLHWAEAPFATSLKLSNRLDTASGLCLSGHSVGLGDLYVARFMDHMKNLFDTGCDGTGCLSLIGWKRRLATRIPKAVAVMVGMLTGISGGILRDVLQNQIPVVFRRELYASVSIFVCVLFPGLRAAGIDTQFNTGICFVVGFGFRMLAPGVLPEASTFSYQQRWNKNIIFGEGCVSRLLATYPPAPMVSKRKVP